MGDGDSGAVISNEPNKTQIELRFPEYFSFRLTESMCVCIAFSCSLNFTCIDEV